MIVENFITLYSFKVQTRRYTTL